ncbi:MAG: GH3 auxin-responsive promoter family protein, partial [Bacteroidaceae bacterium]|nr:GH3 auxin-responsive promoter family protein [Bacteroidaceae bacterium]
MNETRLIGTFFKYRQKAIAQYATQAEAIQDKVLQRLIAKAEKTEWGKEHNYQEIKNYQDFQQQVPVQTYEEIKGYVDRMRHGEKDILWPGQVVWYAKSSGTTNDKSKFIPVSKEGLQNLHYAGGRDAVALYLQQNP